MARPRKAGLEYFPHDVDAANDEKIEAMRAIHGNDGYAFYFILLERVYRTPDAELDLSKLPIRAALAKSIGVSIESFQKMIETACDINLFDKIKFDENMLITSNGIKKRHGEVQNLRENWRKTKEKRDTKNSFLLENPQENHTENDEKSPQSKAKESKANIKANSIYKNAADAMRNEWQTFMTPAQWGTLESEYLNSMDEEAIIYAIIQAKNNGKCNFGYLQSILTSYKANGVRTWIDAQEDRKRFLERKENPPDAKNKPKDGYADIGGV